jgi:hypothetical protein
MEGELSKEERSVVAKSLYSLLVGLQRKDEAAKYRQMM